eukprot:scaffold39179_cov50-Attheya_sp.AAC.4
MTPPTSAPDGGSSQSMISTDLVVGLPTPPLTVLPGDDLTPYILPTAETTDDNNNAERSNKKRRLMMPPKLGFGLHLVEHKQSADTNSEEKKSRMEIRVTHAGQLVNPLTKNNSKNNTWFVRHSTQRYSHPMVGDLVVGVVEEKVSADYYRVNIGAPHGALLHHLEFDGATKRNKPQLSTGDLLYARVLQVSPFMDPLLTCKANNMAANNGDSATSVMVAKDWMTQECLFGELKTKQKCVSTQIKVSLGLARELMRPDNAVLMELGKSSSAYDLIAFEVCIGVNGWIWVHSTSTTNLILITNAIRNSQVMNDAQVRGMVRDLLSSVQTQTDNN